MKKTTLLAASVALALGLVACDKAPTAPQTAAPQAAAPAKVLISGVEQENFDPAVKHAENFFYSVNGKWLNKTEIPADKSNYGSFTKLSDDAQVALRTIIESAAAKTGKTPGTDEQKLGDFYTSYMDEAGIEALGKAPIEADLAKIAAIADADQLASAFAEFQNMGTAIPLGWYVNNDEKNSTQYAVYVGQSG
ncbi:MAG: M13 family metallopeptidase, partial [Gammaproteobacteria bacterium]|nr:M13 family metallopeptidase [Gammaproteobacteria bacterium]